MACLLSPKARPGCGSAAHEPRRAVLRLISVALAVTSFLVVSATTQASPAFSRIVVFGDSLSDTGNAGRFSNGRVWVEFLAARYGFATEPSRMGGSNYAVGGARLDPNSGPSSLPAQVAAYLRANSPEPGTLYIIYGGGNDLLAAVGHPQAQSMVDTAVAALQGIVRDLAARGAKDILVPNLPDVGITPAIRGQGRQAVEDAAQLTNRFNTRVEAILDTRTRDPSLRVRQLDVHALGERVRSDPASLGFTNIAAPCNQRSACEGYLFWDGVHPTTQAHQRLAEAALQALALP
jgi:outer membrane lipase/esterase